MKPFSGRWFLPVAALVAAALGFGIGRASSRSSEKAKPADDPTSAERQYDVPGTTPAARFAKAVRLDPAPRSKHVDSFDTFLAGLSVSDLAAAKASLRAAVSDLDAATLRSYLKAKRRIAPTFREELALEEIATRLGTLDPTGALEMAESGWPPATAKALVSGAFATLARSDPEDASRRASALANSEQRAGAISAVATTLATTDPARGLNFLQSVALGKDALPAVREQFFDAWFASDSAGALRHATAIADGTVKEEAGEDRAGSSLKWIVTAMAKRDPESAFTWIGGLKNPPHGLNYEALVVLADKDAGAAVRKAESFMKAFEDGDLRYAGFRRANWGSEPICWQWITQDADAATAWALALPDSQARNLACNQMFEQLCKSDGRRAVAFLESMPEALAKEAARSSGIRYHLTRALPEEAVRLTLKFADEERNLGRMTSEFYRWGETDPESAVDFLLKQPDAGSEDLADVWDTLLHEVSEDDPARTLALLDSGQLPPSIAHDAKSNALFEWAETDPPAAVAKAMTESNREIRAKALPRLLALLAKSDPAAAAKAALGEFDPALREKLIAQSARTWAATDPARLRTWVQSLSPDEREKVRGEVALASLANEKIPFEEAVKLTSSVPDTDPEATASAIRARAGAQARKAPQAAVEWARELPNDAWRSTAIKGVISEWVGFDPDAATEWTASLGPKDAELSESAAMALGEHFLAGDSIDKAASWIAAIKDPAKRNAIVSARFPYRQDSLVAELVTKLEALGVPKSELDFYRKLGRLPPP